MHVLTGKKKPSLYRIAAVAVLFSCVLLFLQLTPARATGDAASQAKQLQLEATRLQLKGDLENALLKYRESLALSSNPRLEKIVEKLEKRVEATAPPVEVVTATVESATEITEKEEADTATSQINEEQIAVEERKDTIPVVEPPVQIVEKNAETIAVSPEIRETVNEVSAEEADTADPGITETPAPAPEQELPAITKEELPLQKYIPKNEEEKRICDYLEWQLDYFPKQKDGSPTVRTQYILEQEEPDTYQVVFDPFILQAKEKMINIAPIRLTIQLEQDTVAINAHLPDTVSIGEGEERIELSIGSQNIKGRWDEKLRHYTAMDTKFTDLSLIEKREHGATIHIATATAFDTITADPQNNWTEDSSFAFKEIDIKEREDFQLRIDTISGTSNASGQDIALYLDKITNNIFEFSDFFAGALTTKSMALDLADIGTIIKLWAKGKSKVEVRGITANIDGGTVKIDMLMSDGSMEKSSDDEGLNWNNTFSAEGLQIGAQETEGHPFEGLKIGKIEMNTAWVLRPIPENLFADMDAMLDSIAQAEDTENLEVLFPEGRDIFLKFLGLLYTCGTNAEVSEINIFPGKEEPQIHLDSASAAYTFFSPFDSEGFLSSHLAFSGLKQEQDQEAILPVQAKFAIKLNKIPALTELIAKTEGIPFTKLEEKLPDLFLQHLMTSNLTLNITDSFLAFPESVLNFTGESSLNSEAAFSATGSIDINMRNPENFLGKFKKAGEILPGMEQALGMYTALADRKTTEDGITTDTLVIEVTQEGKILSNGKDVTSMFIPME